MRSIRWQAIAAVLALVTSAAAQRQSVTLPAGAPVHVRIIETLSSDTSKPGQVFHGTLAEPLMVNGRTLFPKGTDVTGRVLVAHPSGRLSDPGMLELALTSFRTRRGSYAINTPPITLKGDSHTKSNVTKIGGGTAAGAILGGIFGGGKGAAIGAGAGAAAGTGVAAATGKKEIRLASETILTWTTSRPVEVAAYQDASYRDRDGDDDWRERRDRRHNDRDGDDDDDWREARDERRDHDRPVSATIGIFSDRDRQVIRSCYQSDTRGLPPGLAKRDRLPPGLERQVQRNGTLPPGLQKRVQPLPEECVASLPPLPTAWVRVVLGRRVLLLNAEQRILDLFDLD